MSGRRLAGLLAGLLLLAAPARAHLNSPHVYAEHRIAGHDVLIIVHMPEAVPGEAEVQVRLRDAEPGEEIVVRTREIPPEGEDHSPGWKEASRSRVDERLYTSPLPLFLFGPWSVEVEIESERGEGLVRIPFQAEVPRPTEMPWWLAGILAALCLLSVASIWSIMRAIGRDSRRSPDEPEKPRDRRLGAWLGTGTAAVIVAFLAFTIGTWRLYDAGHWLLLAGTQPKLETFVVSQPARTGRLNELRMLVTDSQGQPLGGLGRIEGRPMLATLVSLPEASQLQLLEVAQVNPGAFVTGFRPETTGRHRLFGTVRREAGDLTTLVADLEVAAGAPGPAAPGEPGLRSSHPPLGERLEARETRFEDGAVLAWRRDEGTRSVVQEFERFTFTLRDAEGRPLDLAGPSELLVMREDGEVFARLTPQGSLAALDPGGERSPVSASATEEPAGQVSFPYAFPVEGRYRLWAILRDGSGPRVAAFDVDVAPGG